MPQPENQRVAAGIDQLVNPTRLEAAWNVDVRIRRNDRMLGALVVEADPAFDARESPAVGRYWDPRVSGIAAPRQARFARVQRQGGWLRVEAWPGSGNAVMPRRPAMYSTRTGPSTRAIGGSRSVRPLRGR